MADKCIHKRRESVILLPDGTVYQKCMQCGGNVIKVENEFRSIEVKHVKDGDYTVKFSGDSKTVSERRDIEKGNTKEEAVPVTDSSEPAPAVPVSEIDVI